MSRRLACLLLGLLLCLCAATALAADPFRPPEGQVLVRFKATVGVFTARQRLADLSARLERGYGFEPGAGLVIVEYYEGLTARSGGPTFLVASPLPVPEVMDRLRQVPGVEAVAGNYRRGIR